MKIIKRVVEARGTLNLAKASSFGRFQLHNSSANSLVAQNQSIRCIYCIGSSCFLESCTAVKEAKYRKAMLIQSGCCFNCLKLNHQAKDYDCNKKCHFCQDRHHHSLCEAPIPSSWEQPHSPTDNHLQKTTVNTNTTVRGTQLILLQTARAVATNQDESCSQEVKPRWKLFSRGQNFV